MTLCLLYMTDVLAMAEQMEVPVQHIFSSIRRRGLIAGADVGRGVGSLITPSTVHPNAR
jgi:hypothetical protein